MGEDLSEFERLKHIKHIEEAVKKLFAERLVRSANDTLLDLIAEATSVYSIECTSCMKSSCLSDVVHLAKDLSLLGWRIIDGKVKCPECVENETPITLTISEIRLENLNTLIAEFKTQAALAERLDLKPNYFSQIVTKKRGMGHGTARQIEEKLGKPTGWMDQTP